MLCFTIVENYKPKEVVEIKPTEKIGFVDLALNLDESLHVKVNILDIHETLFLEGLIDKNFKQGKHIENLNLSELESGLYNINVMYSDKVFSKKLIVMNN